MYDCMSRQTWTSYSHMDRLDNKKMRLSESLQPSVGYPSWRLKGFAELQAFPLSLEENEPRTWKWMGFRNNDGFSY